MLDKTKEQDIIEVVFTIDENYVQHCAVTITSLCNNTPNAKINISIVHNGISKKNISKLNKYLKSFVNINQVNWLEINPELLKDAPLTHHVSLATYYRILLPDILDKNLNKVLFLDSDLIIRENITPLWQTEISQFSHAGVIEYGTDHQHKKSIGISEDSLYFNAGVMLINLDYWRDYNISQKAVQYIRENKEQITLWDQDVLNYIIESKWLPVEPKWNATAIVFKSELWEQRGFASQLCEQLEQVKNNPSIIHFTGSAKPWHYYHNHPHKNDYYYYLKKTPWRNFTPIGQPSLRAKISGKIRQFISSLKKIISGF
jgi:lipopolysaccharide biosynthesis glycosyltransferase